MMVYAAVAVQAYATGNTVSGIPRPWSVTVKIGVAFFTQAGKGRLRARPLASCPRWAMAEA